MKLGKRNLVSAGTILLLLFIFLLLLSAYWFKKMNKQLVHIPVRSGPIVNPLMGWMPWANIKESRQPHTLVYADLTWREFEPQEGVFDFATFEKEQQLVRWRREGKRVVFRFVLDVPRDDAHKDIPDWLFERINGEGNFYENEYGKGFSPDYSNPTLLKHHQLAVQALGDRYGKDGFFTFIELGSLGHWGEWHISPGIGQLPAEIIRDRYVYDYLNAFPNTHLMMRRPFTIARELNLGLFNDMTGNVDHTNEWLGWIKYGGDYLPDEKNSLVPMLDGWKLAPVGGEQAPNISNEKMYKADLDTTLKLLQESHTTFVGPGGPYDIEFGGALQDGVDTVLSTIGYRLFVDHVELPISVKFGREIHIKFWFSNNGIAPFYYDWTAMVYLFNEDGSMVAAYPLQMDLREILPGEMYEVPFVLPVKNLENGTYRLGFAIIDPLSGKPGIELANGTARNDLIQEVGSFNIAWTFDFTNK